MNLLFLFVVHVSWTTGINISNKNQFEKLFVFDVLFVLAPTFV